MTEQGWKLELEHPNGMGGVLISPAGKQVRQFAGDNQLFVCYGSKLVTLLNQVVDLDQSEVDALAFALKKYHGRNLPYEDQTQHNRT